MKKERNYRPVFSANIAIDSIFAYLAVVRKAEDWQLAASWQPAGGCMVFVSGKKG